MRHLLLIILLFISVFSFSQKTKVYGVVKDQKTNEILPYVTIFFLDSKISTITDSIGRYSIETYYATDSLVFDFTGYDRLIKPIKLDVSQEINVFLSPELEGNIEELKLYIPKETPSVRLHKRIVANKRVNNKEKLDSYEYELYTKVQIDVDNVGNNFLDKAIIGKMNVLESFIDSSSGKKMLPAILSESLSDFYYLKDPTKKREIIKGTYITGVNNLQLNQFLGNMYLDINIYENSINMFNQTFISPLASYARNFYKFRLVDSSFVGNKWCYKMLFYPKRSSDMTLEGEMWVHDTTYAIQKFSAKISPGINLNYINSFTFEQEFDMVAPEVWMLVNETMHADVKLLNTGVVNGVVAHKTASRSKYIINIPHDKEFYNSDYNVEIDPAAKSRNQDYWVKYRHGELNKQERGVLKMMDTLQNLSTFKTFKKLAYFFTTGYYMLNKIEVGKASSLYSHNPVEGDRFALAVRTSNNFSRRLELGTRFAFGLADLKLKYGASIRYNITPKKRGMLTLYYNYDIEQIGQSPSASTVGSTFGTLFRTGPLDKLTFVEKWGVNLEKDVKKDIVLYGGFEHKEYTPLGLANYVRYNQSSASYDTIRHIATSEILLRFRWTKDEEFIAGSFDRSTLRSKFPIFSFQAIFGVKGLLGADYNYQKLEFKMDHNTRIGVLGKMMYGINAGCVLGQVAYPFLKVHEGNQSYWLVSNSFNMLNYFEFISDRYVGAYIENHWGGLFFDLIPYVDKMKLRVVSSARTTYGSISTRHASEMELPSFTKKFGTIPYAECSVGIENIFRIIRVDMFVRLTHLDPGMSPYGFRIKTAVNF